MIQKTEVSNRNIFVLNSCKYQEAKKLLLYLAVLQKKAKSLNIILDGKLPPKKLQQAVTISESTYFRNFAYCKKFKQYEIGSNKSSKKNREDPDSLMLLNEKTHYMDSEKFLKDYPDFEKEQVNQSFYSLPLRTF